MCGIVGYVGKQQAEDAVIEHTRWATNGPADVKAHRHLGATDRVALVHDGIIDNFAELRSVALEGALELKELAYLHASLACPQLSRARRPRGRR
jgi:glucosamine 6-phosphate synthetase-like amidotransferase/phosphosugar isomerase protein